ncbi:hypothetical protein T492DRAFT_1019622, partial [Pavlovales sp. CCMP2436]
TVTLKRSAYAARHGRRPYGAGPPRDGRGPSCARRHTRAAEPWPPLHAAAADGRRASSTSHRKKGRARTSKSEASDDRESKNPSLAGGHRRQPELRQRAVTHHD